MRIDLTTCRDPDLLAAEVRRLEGAITALADQDATLAKIIDYDIGRKPLPDILADYRQWRSQQEDRIGTHSDDCHMWPRHERCMIHRLASALEKERQVFLQGNLTLSEAEREVLVAVAEDAELRLSVPSPAWRPADQTARVVRGLLQRMGGEQ